MAIEEEVFINSMGEEVSITNLVNEMINYYALKVGVGESKITDFNEGSEIRNLLESFAVDLYVLLLNQEQLTQICFVETAEGEWLDKHGANPFVQLPREAGSVANGFIKFTVPDALTSELNIPAGTVVAASETGLEYETLSDVILGIGETTVTASIESLTIGEDCNAGVGDIDTLVSDIGVNGVILSTIVSMAVVDIPWETGKLIHKLFEQSSKKYYINLILYFILTIISCAVVHFITIEINTISTCGKIILKGIISVIISSFIVALFTFRTREFKYLIKYINSKIKR